MVFGRKRGAVPLANDDDEGAASTSTQRRTNARVTNSSRAEEGIPLNRDDTDANTDFDDMEDESSVQGSAMASSRPDVSKGRHDSTITASVKRKRCIVTTIVVLFIAAIVIVIAVEVKIYESKLRASQQQESAGSAAGETNNQENEENTAHDDAVASPEAEPGHLKEPDQDVVAICSSSLIQFPNGLSNCKGLCGVAACCFFDAESSPKACYDANKKVCDMYSACKILYSGDGSYGNNSSNTDTEEGSGVKYCSLEVRRRHLTDSSVKASSGETEHRETKVSGENSTIHETPQLEHDQSNSGLAACHPDMIECKSNDDCSNAFLNGILHYSCLPDCIAPSITTSVNVCAAKDKNVSMSAPDNSNQGHPKLMCHPDSIPCFSNFDCFGLAVDGLAYEECAAECDDSFPNHPDINVDDTLDNFFPNIAARNKTKTCGALSKAGNGFDEMVVVTCHPDGIECQTDDDCATFSNVSICEDGSESGANCTTMPLTSCMEECGMSFGQNLTGNLTSFPGGGNFSYDGFPMPGDGPMLPVTWLNDTLPDNSSYCGHYVDEAGVNATNNATVAESGKYIECASTAATCHSDEDCKALGRGMKCFSECGLQAVFPGGLLAGNDFATPIPPAPGFNDTLPEISSYCGNYIDNATITAVVTDSGEYVECSSDSVTCESDEDCKVVGRGMNCFPECGPQAIFPGAGWFGGDDFPVPP